jgi:hypothetical protein
MRVGHNRQSLDAHTSEGIVGSKFTEDATVGRRVRRADFEHCTTSELHTNDVMIPGRFPMDLENRDSDDTPVVDAQNAIPNA